MFFNRKNQAQEAPVEPSDQRQTNILRETLREINDILTTPKIFLWLNLIFILIAIFLGRIVINETDLVSHEKTSLSSEAREASHHNAVNYLSNITLSRGTLMSQDTIYTSISNPKARKKVHTIRMGGPISQYIKNSDRKHLTIDIETPYGEYSFPLSKPIEANEKISFVNRSECHNIKCLLDVQIDFHEDVVTPRHGVYSAKIEYNENEYGASKNLRYNTLADESDLIDFTAIRSDGKILINIHKRRSNVATVPSTYAIVFDYTTKDGGRNTRAVTVPNAYNSNVAIRPPADVSYGEITVRDINYIATGGRINKVYIVGNHPLHPNLSEK